MNIERRYQSQPAGWDYFHGLLIDTPDAPVFGEEPDKQQEWRHSLHRLSGRGDWTRKR